MNVLTNKSIKISLLFSKEVDSSHILIIIIIIKEEY